MWLGLVFTGLSLLLWLGIAGLAIWAALRWIVPRWRTALATPAAYVAPQPSAIETLRHRYALGEIDAPTFEQMVERILASEARERNGEQPSAPPLSDDPEVYTV